MNRSLLFITIGIIAGLIVFAVFARKNTPQQSSSNSVIQSSTNSTSETTSSNVITYDGSSFSPNSMTDQSGATVTIKNTSNKSVQFDSDPHPQHTDNAALNVGLIGAGKSMTITLTQKGMFGYHSHLDPAQRGTIAVQ